MSITTSDLTTVVAVTREIVEMHQSFVKWFTGQCPRDKDGFTASIASHFADSFQIVFPGGELLSGTTLFDKMYRGYAGSPAFNIQIRNIEIHPLDSQEHLLYATYEEWMKHSMNTNPPNNGRITTVIFERAPIEPNGLLWLHVHETWLPREVMDAEEYDF